MWYLTKETKCTNSEILNVYTRLFIFICKLYWSYSHYVNSISPSVGAITCWQSIPLTHVSSVTDIIESSLGVVIVDHVLCDCFSFRKVLPVAVIPMLLVVLVLTFQIKSLFCPRKPVSFRSVTRHKCGGESSKRTHLSSSGALNIEISQWTLAPWALLPWILHCV